MMPSSRGLGREQWAVFGAATLGYGLYYVCRLSLSVVKTPVIAEGVLTEAQMGLVGSALFYVYAVGKFTNGFLADRVSLRRMFAFGLLASALVNLALGWLHGFAAFFVLWAVNGWVQSMGAPACVVGLTRWFERRQRGTAYGLWSSSHNIGEGLTFILTAAVVSAWGWRAGFEAAGLAGLGGAVLIWLLFRDRPAAAPDTPAAPAAATGGAQRAVLRNPVVWCLALASACMYVTRYAVNSWGMFFLQNARGHTAVEAGSLVAVSSVCGVLGTVASGWVSDRFFGGDRFRPAFWSGVLNAASLALFLFAPASWGWAPAAAMVGFGLAIGALVCYLGGLMAVDSVPKEAAGAALGVVGIASYLGAGTQDVLSGWLIGRGRSGDVGAATYDFTPVSLGWLAAALASVALGVAAGRFHRRQMVRVD
jgi:OPA family sugar phosphate sensor protein UhpC-like MFS transporter